MNARRSTTASVFETCVRCGYALRGLPANHACPECGLRYDDRCVQFRVINPRQVLVLWLLILGGGWVALRNLPHVFNLAAASMWDRIGALAGALWLVFFPLAAWLVVRRLRRGMVVAITRDGLIIRLPGFSDALIPWSDVSGAAIKPRPASKPQVARVFLTADDRTVEIGGVANVFPDHATVAQFVAEVGRRVASATGAPTS